MMPDESPGVVSRHIFNLFWEYRDRPFIFLEPWGNFGDQLIWKGAQKLAQAAGLNVKSMHCKDYTPTDFSNNTVIYIHGGGGFFPDWLKSGHAVALIKAVNSHCGVTILGPHTFFADTSFLQKTVIDHFPTRGPGQVYVFTREQRSYDILKQCWPGWIELGLDHDTALNLNAADLVTQTPPKRYTFYGIRTDPEAIAFQNRDLLAFWADPVDHCYTFEQWVALHHRAKEIITNRLHSAIAGATFGIPTMLLPNNYHKNRSVWEYSLQQRGILWCDTIQLRPIAQKINVITPIRKLLELPQSQRFLRVFVHRVRYKTLIP